MKQKLISIWALSSLLTGFIILVFGLIILFVLFSADGAYLALLGIVICIFSGLIPLFFTPEENKDLLK